ncbi:NAD-dependent epimerase/dehydratase family protein [Chloroflexota bacterium]
MHNYPRPYPSKKEWEADVTLRSRDTILVTGGCGFIGSALIRAIRSDYENVHIKVLDNLSHGVLPNIEGLNVELIEADILDAETINSALDNVDVVFNLAALPFIPDSYQDPYSFFNVNGNGAAKLLVKVMASKTRLFVHVSTCEVYGPAQNGPLQESHPTNPVSMYAASKLAAEKVAYALYEEHKLPVVIIRSFNTYGPRDSYPRIIPELIRQLHKGGELRLGNIHVTRDFTYVEDMARGILLAGTTSKALGKVMNLCSGVETSVEQLIALVANLMGQNDYRISVEKARLRASDLNSSWGDNTLAREIVGWKPEITLEDGLKRTIEWYKKTGKWQWE